jgi:hypothetical protein
MLRHFEITRRSVTRFRRTSNGAPDKRAGEDPGVAVGTTIADRPPHRSVHARLRIRLLLWMTSGEAYIRMRMQSAGLGNPPQINKTLPIRFILAR